MNKQERKNRKVKSSRRRRNVVEEEVINETLYIDDLAEAMGSDHQSKKDLVRSVLRKPIYVEYKTYNQELLATHVQENDIVFAPGPAGTGKSFIATYMALKLIRHSETPYDKIVIIKPAVEVAGENLGFLPGGVDDKIGPYTYSTVNLIEKIVGEENAGILVREGIIQPSPLAYIRGCTFDNAIVIAEEFQNVSPYMMKTFLSRIGENTKYIITGDINQSDKYFHNPSESGLADAIKRLDRMEGIITDFKFNLSDIVRSPRIQAILERYEENDADYQ
jgi:phosphate starvation-inducible protein PhoH and related proteins